MGNSYGVPWFRAVGEQEASTIFNDLDRDKNGFVTLKELMGVDGPGHMMPHSLPALYFFDKERTGNLTRAEFGALLRFCEAEKLAVEASLSHDREFRNLIRRASVAGVKDGSARGRHSFRRFSSYSNVRSIFKKDGDTANPVYSPPASPDLVTDAAQDPKRHCPDRKPEPASDEDDIGASSVSRPSLDDPHTPPNSKRRPPRHPSSSSGVSNSDSPSPRDGSVTDMSNSSASSDESSDDEQDATATNAVRMYSSQREFQDQARPAEDPDAALAPLDAQNRTAVDAAVLEKIMRTNITKLAELLQNEMQRVEFMEWLWKLTDFNRQGVVTLEELRIFLAALEEDGISLEELAFYKEGGVPLEESIVNEFDTTHTGLLTRDEFLVLADLVTREYEFWQNRHLDRVGDYELGRTIGRGSSGIVRIGIHVQTRESVAIKIIKKGNCSALSRLDREIASLAMAEQENIVDLLEVLDSDENVFIVMELCGGGSLVDIVLLYPDERIPERIARNYLRQLFEALAFLHRNGICHRDIRLDNLMLSNNGVLKITDFGHSGKFQPGWDLFQTTLVGSVYNLSPEQIDGLLYSGEKIDVWSGGIVAYCLLVGRPPFFDSDTNAFLQSIKTGTFDIPDFVSPEAADMIRCMIRVKPEARIPYEQMLHHPWFYSGPESRPVMDTVVIPVDPFFKKRPDLAEMIMAGTIHEHNLHFHLADTANPRSFPGVLRGQAWALKCMSLDMNIKFTVSLFTTEPSNARAMQQVYSCSKLMNTMNAQDGLSSLGVEPVIFTSSTSGSPSDSQPYLRDVNKRAQSDLGVRSIDVGPPVELSLPHNLQDTPPPSVEDVATPTTPRQANGADVGPSVEETSPGNISISASVSEGELGSLKRSSRVNCTKNGCAESSAAPKRRSRGSGSSLKKHMRSKSLDFTDDWQLRISRSVTVDAFPYQQVLPKREMPHQARELNFDRPDDALAERSEDTHPNSRSELTSTRNQLAPLELRGIPRSRTLENLPSMDDIHARLRTGDGNTIVRRLIRHPSKAVPPQSPQGRRLHSNGVAVPGADGTDSSSECSSASPQTSHSPPPSIDVQQQARPVPPPRTTKRCVSDTAAKPPVPEFMPYIEVRLRDGESGLFLRICRKLKTICDTKLANAAERQKRRVVGRRSLAVLRRTASQRAAPGPVAEPVQEEVGV